MTYLLYSDYFPQYLIAQNIVCRDDSKSPPFPNSLQSAEEYEHPMDTINCMIESLKKFKHRAMTLISDFRFLSVHVASLDKMHCANYIARSRNRRESRQRELKDIDEVTNHRRC